MRHRAPQLQGHVSDRQYFPKRGHDYLPPSWRPVAERRPEKVPRSNRPYIYLEAFWRQNLKKKFWRLEFWTTILSGVHFPIRALTTRGNQTRKEQLVS